MTEGHWRSKWPNSKHGDWGDRRSYDPRSSWDSKRHSPPAATSDARHYQVPAAVLEAFHSLRPIPAQRALVEFADDDAPLFEELVRKSKKRAKLDEGGQFYADVQAGDRLCAQIRTVSAIMLDVELMCSMARFRRVLSDAGLGRFKVMHDRSELAFQPNEYVEVIVEQVLPARLENGAAPPQRLELRVDLERAPLQIADFPYYYRAVLQDRARAPVHSLQPDPEPTPEPIHFCDLPSVQRLVLNPTADYAYGFARRVDQSALPAFRGQDLRLPETSDQLLEAQQKEMAEAQIRKAGQYIKEGLNFEAIQACNNALRIKPDHLDALLGRAVAAHNMDNIVSAIIDLEKILETNPNHERAKRILARILVESGEQYEESKDLTEARKNFDKALKLDPTLTDALNGVKRLDNLNSNRKRKASVTVIDLTEEGSSNSNNPTKDNKKAAPRFDDDSRKRLAEIEKFKQKLMQNRKR